MIEMSSSIFLLAAVLVALVATIVFLGSFRMPRNYRDEQKKREEIRGKLISKQFSAPTAVEIVHNEENKSTGQVS